MEAKHAGCGHEPWNKGKLVETVTIPKAVAARPFLQPT